MSIEKLTDDELHEATLRAAVHEKQATYSLLCHLHEVERRMLYAVRGYSSLWSYTHTYLKYSGPQTSERVSSMRLAFRIPEIRSSLEQNKVCLTTLSMLAVAKRRHKMKNSEVLSLFKQIEDKPTREVEKVIAGKFPDLKTGHVKPVSESITEILIQVDEAFIQQMNRIKELSGNLGLGPQEIFQLAMTFMIRERERRLTPSLRAREVRKNTKSIPIATRREVFRQSGGRCEYVDPQTKRRCESKTGVQTDHVIPAAVGGTHAIENLRTLCAAHNRLMAMQFFGKNKMSHYLKNLESRLRDSSSKVP